MQAGWGLYLHNKEDGNMRLGDISGASDVALGLEPVNRGTLQDKLERLGKAVVDTKNALDHIEGKMFGYRPMSDKVAETPESIDSIIEAITEFAESALKTSDNILGKL